MAYSDKKKVYTILKGAFTKKTFDDFMKNLALSKDFSQFKKEIKVKTISEWDGKDKMT